MRISVIIPAYKARRFLPDCLDSIGRQTRLPDEVIVVDDASPEGVEDIVSSYAERPGYPPLVLLKHDMNQGQAAARNTGISACSGDWIAFLDHDDIWDPGHLAQQEQTALASGADLVFCPARLFWDSPGEEPAQIARPYTEAEKQLRPFALMKNCFIITSSCLVRRNSLEQVGGFDPIPDVRAVEDLDCFLKMLRVGAKFVMAQEATLHYRKHPESATCRKGHMIRQIVFAVERHLDWVEATRSEKSEFRVRLAWKAAKETAFTRAADQASWLTRALRLSATRPIVMTRGLAGYLRVLLTRGREPLNKVH